MVVDLAANVLACFVPTAYAEELPEEYQPDDPSTEHIHTDECYEIIWLCGFEEHVHEPSCYSDSTADLETSEIWEASLPVLTGEWADDIVLIARSQLGCSESERNFILADDGKTKNGITR